MNGKTIKIDNIGVGDLVHIEKLYGPLIACDVRVRLEHPGIWVVERQVLTPSDDPDGGDDETWEEMTRFDCLESLHLCDPLHDQGG